MFPKDTNLYVFGGFDSYFVKVQTCMYLGFVSSGFKVIQFSMYLHFVEIETSTYLGFVSSSYLRYIFQLYAPYHNLRLSAA